MTISLIAAIDLNRGLGYQNELLVKLPNDMKNFKKLTTGHFVVQGRKTYESIGYPLSNRHNIILTRDNKYKAPLGTYVYHSVEDVIKAYNNQNNNESELFFIGGAEVYKQALPHVDKIYLTVIENNFSSVDSYFPSFSLNEFKPIENIFNPLDEKNPYNHSFITYERKINNK